MKILGVNTKIYWKVKFSLYAMTEFIQAHSNKWNNIINKLSTKRLAFRLLLFVFFCYCYCCWWWWWRLRLRWCMAIKWNALSAEVKLSKFIATCTSDTLNHCGRNNKLEALAKQMWLSFGYLRAGRKLLWNDNLISRQIWTQTTFMELKLLSVFRKSKQAAW